MSLLSAYETALARGYWLSIISIFTSFLIYILSIVSYPRGRAVRYYTVFCVVFGIVRFNLLLINANDYGNQYNESDPKTAKFGGKFLECGSLLKNFIFRFANFIPTRFWIMRLQCNLMFCFYFHF